jgi:hypothetical protein
MKVIAQTGKKTFLVACNAEELDALAGRTIGDSYGYTERHNCLGISFDICAAWTRLNRDTRRRDEVNAVRRQLQNIIEGLDVIGPFIEEPPKIETPEPPPVAG